MTDNIFGFLRTHFGKVGIFGIILAILEKITEDDFVCPCDKTYNIAICVFYGAVPAICCFIYTLCYMDLSPQTDGATQNISMINFTNVSTPPSLQTEDGATQNIPMRNNTNVSTPPSPQTDGATQNISMINFRNVSTPPSPQTDGATQDIPMRNFTNVSTPPSLQTDGATQNNSMINFTNVSTPPSPQTDGATQDIPMINFRNVSTPLSPQTDGPTQEICTCKKVRYSILTALFWICLFFLDGRYMACARSTWKGVYTKNESLGILKWCKPTGNEPSVLDSQQKTLKWMCKSQIVGFTLMFFIVIYLPASKYWQKYCGECSYCCCCAVPVLLLVLVLLASFL